MEDLYAVACSSGSSIATGSLQCSEQLVSSPSTSWHHQQNQSKQRKRLAKIEIPAVDRLNSAQRGSVLASPDRTIFGDDRCLASLFEAEERSAATNLYFGLTQKEVEPRMREATCDWMFDVCAEERCDPELYPLAVSFMDRFLSIENIFKGQLQGVASACLFIASKVKAPTPFTAKRLSYYTDKAVSVSELMSWELLVLSRLRWDVATVTAFDFADQVFARAPMLGGLRRDFQLAVHRIQRAHQLALMQPSLQACICLQYAALRSRNSHLIRSADLALQGIFAVDVNLLRQYAEYVEIVMQQAMVASSLSEAEFAGFDGSSIDGHAPHLMMQTPPPHHHNSKNYEEVISQQQQTFGTRTPTDIEAVPFN